MSMGKILKCKSEQMGYFVDFPLTPWDKFSAPLVLSPISSLQSLNYVRLFETPMDCSTPGLPVHHQLLEFTQTHVH